MSKSIATTSQSQELKAQNDREAHFLASQQARLDKIRINAEQQNALLDNGDVQQQRKEFWILMKRICSSLNSRLSLLMGESCEVESKSDDKSAPITIYVTAQQRNDALQKLQEIQLTIRCLGHYTLHSSNFTSDDEQYLPSELIGFSMPELPTADLRLLNIEIQNLKSNSLKAQDVIIPKEKFRFKRYRKAIQKRKEGKIDEDVDFEIGDENNNDSNLHSTEMDTNNENDTTQSIPIPAHQQFDGVSIVGKQHCSIKVDLDGNFTFFDNDSVPSVEMNSNDKNVPSEAKAFMIRDLEGCNIIVEGTYSSLHVINTKNTSIDIRTPIAGPVHVTGCDNTNLYIQFCRQLRIHDCSHVSFYIHVASGPIIEGCKEMKFYQRDYVSNGNDAYDKEDNLYWDVKDFHWLKNLVKSPNFTVISNKEEAVTNKAATNQDENPINHHDDFSSKASENDNESSDDDEL